LGGSISSGFLYLSALGIDAISVLYHKGLVSVKGKTCNASLR